MRQAPARSGYRHAVTTPNPTQDPGWGGPKGILLMLVPVVQKRAVGADGLINARRVFGAFCTAIALIFVVLLFMGLSTRDRPLTQAQGIAIATLVGAVSLGASVWFGRRSLDCSDLAGSYRQRFFLRLAMAEASALVAFVLVFQAGTIWVYVVGAAFTYAGFALLAPTKEHLLREQRRLVSAGCRRSLIAALRGVDVEYGS
jgi:hypothetical protein